MCSSPTALCSSMFAGEYLQTRKAAKFKEAGEKQTEEHCSTTAPTNYFPSNGFQVKNRMGKGKKYSTFIIYRFPFCCRNSLWKILKKIAAFRYTFCLKSQFNDFAKARKEI